MPYTLAYKDRYKRVAESAITSDTSDSVAFASLPDDEPTQLIAEWTGKQFTKLLSSVYMGANLMFPEIANEIIWQLIKVAHQPIYPTLAEAGDCVEFGASASFIKFSPDNPYIAGDKSAGWNKEAWYKWGEFDTLFPDWIDNWLGGIIGAITGYETGDILFNIESIPINPIDAFLNGGGLLPKVEIHFNGAGVVEVTLLSFPLGGKAIIELDEEPNVLDILTGGIIDPSAFLVELNRDIINFPPDEYPIVNIEIPVETAGAHVLYIVYVPTLDDSLIPTAFGGGFRSVEFCGFEQEGIVSGIESVIWDGCALKTVVAGIETTIVTAAEIQACMDIPEGGGGGGGAVTSKVYRMGNIGFGTTTGTGNYSDITGMTLNHTPSKSNMLVLVNGVQLLNSAGNQPITIRILADGNVGLDTVEEGVTNSVLTDVSIADRWVVTPNVEIAIKLQWKTPSGTMTRSERGSTNVTIIEYDNEESLFVQDIRIFEGELQKKIGGIWLDVTDSLEAILSSISATASAALATASAAQATANNAAAVNATQTAQIAAHELRLDDMDLSIADIDLSIAGLGAITDGHETRLDALEAASSSGSYWSQTFDFTASDGGWVANGGGVGSYGAGQGWQSENGLGVLEIRLPSLFAGDGRITHMNARLRADNALGALPNTYLIRFPFEGGVGNRYVASTGTTSDGWYKVENIDENYLYVLRIEMAIGAIDFTLRTLRFLGKGDNPF